MIYIRWRSLDLLSSTVTELVENNIKEVQVEPSIMLTWDKSVWQGWDEQIWTPDRTCTRDSSEGKSPKWSTILQPNKGMWPESAVCCNGIQASTNPCQFMVLHDFLLHLLSSLCRIDMWCIESDEARLQFVYFTTDCWLVMNGVCS